VGDLDNQDRLQADYDALFQQYEVRHAGQAGLQDRTAAATAAGCLSVQVDLVLQGHEHA
jgi:hypothetical protein